MTTVVGVGVLAHGLHVAIVLLGLWGLGAVLLPYALESRARRHPRPTAPERVHVDEHARRIAELRIAAASGTLATLPPARIAASSDLSKPEPITVLSVPLVLVAGTAAAGIHAAVAPLHLREDPLFALFFVVAATAQLWWITALATRPRAAVLRAGIYLNAALIGLWGITRLVGLPLGLLPEPHPVGGWDVAGVVWQLIAIAASVRVLRDGVPHRLPGWFDWHPSARAAAGAASVVLVLLALSGAHA